MEGARSRAGDANCRAHRDPTRPRQVHGRPNLGYAFIHTAIDDHSRLAYSEILPDEQGPTAAAFWSRAHAPFASIILADLGADVIKGRKRRSG